MNRSRLFKSTIGMTSALTLMMATNTVPAKASLAKTTTNKGITVSSAVDGSANSLAGICLSLENYYADSLENKDVADDEVAKEATATAAPAATTAKADKTKTKTKTTTKKAKTKKVSKYAKTGIATVNNYINIRKKPTTDSEILGKLYKGCSAEILKTEGEWVKVKSGSVTGYIKKEFLAIGEEAEKVAEKYGDVYAVIKTETLRLREKKSTDSRILTLLAADEKYHVISHDSKWAKIKIDDNLVGYVSKEFVDIKVEFGKAISIKEEQEEAERRAAQEAAIAAAEAERQASSQASTSTTTRTTTSNNTTKKSNTTTKKASESTTSSKSGSAVANYALQFVGNSYRWGGTSLTNGTDCSGFTMSVYKHFGISLARTSSAQSQSAGRKVSTSSLQAGDLVFYGSGGSVSHVAIYIGGGRIVHASNRKDGIKTSSVNYQTPICARRVL